MTLPPPTPAQIQPQPPSTNYKNRHKKDPPLNPNPYEFQFSYHRAIRRGSFIAVRGTTAAKLPHETCPTPQVSEGNERDTTTEPSSSVHYPNDAPAQAHLTMSRCIKAVTALGGKLEDVVRVRMFVARQGNCEAVGAALRMAFGGGDSPAGPGGGGGRGAGGEEGGGGGGGTKREQGRG